MLRHHDLVEVIPTQRHGEIDAVDQYVSSGENCRRVAGVYVPRW